VGEAESGPEPRVVSGSGSLTVPSRNDFAVVCLLPGVAKADYICDAFFSPLTTINKGTSGYVQFTTYTGPDCSGSFISSWSICSTGATATSCINNTQFHYTLTQLLARWDAVRLALSSNVRVNVPGNTCIGGSGFCAGYVNLNAN